MEGSSSFSVIEPILTHLSVSLANPLRKREGAACQRRGPGGACQGGGKRSKPESKAGPAWSRSSCPTAWALSSSKLSPSSQELRPDQAHC